MTTLPDAERADARVSDLYRHNLTQLGKDDIVIATHGGSGQSLIGNILAELGLNYVDAYTEELHADGRTTAVDRHASYRSHLASQHDKDAGAEPVRLWPRFVKTHHPPSVFAGATIGGVWRLVRDPRDTLYAAYQWRAGFAEEEWDKVPGTLLEWLRSPGDFSRGQTDDWVGFYTAWADRARACEHDELLRFEDLKTRPVPVVTAALTRVGAEVTEAEVTRAVDASSFAKMRAHEDQGARDGGRDDGAPRVIREGRTDGWKGWMTPELATFFTGEELRALARTYGYDLPGAS